MLFYFVLQVKPCWRARDCNGREGETISPLLMESLCESEHYLGGVHRQSNNSVLCVVSSHTTFQMAGCGYALFHFSFEPLWLWMTPTPHRVPGLPLLGNSLPVQKLFQVPTSKIIIWPFLKGNLYIFLPLEVSLFCSILFRLSFILSFFFLGVKIPLSG